MIWRGLDLFFEVGRWESGSVRVLDNERHGCLEILGGGVGSLARYSLAAFYNR
jgi:hypothetical protein